MTSQDASPNRRLFNAPAVVLALGGAILLSWPVQAYLLPDGGYSLALSSQAIAEGRWWTPLTHMLVHGGWLHAGMNAAVALALGSAARRLFAPGAGGAGAFLLFYALCGLAGGLGFLALHWQGAEFAVGASGAVYGLWGAFGRATPWPGVVGPLWSPQMRRQAVGAAVSNIVVVIVGLGLGMGIAWEAHVAGFIAGALLIGPLSRLSSRHRDLP